MVSPPSMEMLCPVTASEEISLALSLYIIYIYIYVHIYVYFYGMVSPPSIEMR